MLGFVAFGGAGLGGGPQLAQPVLTLVRAAALLGEPVSPATIVTSLLVLACVAATERARVDHVAAGTSAPVPGATR